MSTAIHPRATPEVAALAAGTLAFASDSASASPIGDADASRFLAQASMGASRAEMARVQWLGYEGWIDEQIAMAPSTSRWDWLLARGYDDPSYRYTQQGFDAASWCKLISSPDTLRQRVALALSEILVVGVDGLKPGGWSGFAGAYYQDLLEKNAFGNFRQLLEDVTLSPAMGMWLSYRGNAKANPETGSLPDENYAREIMQLFTIGLFELEPDGMPRLVDGRVKETYGQADVMGLARVWTGWDWDLAGGTQATPDFKGRPMRQFPARCETGSKTFLGVTIPPGTNGQNSMRIALDTLFTHPNVGPFIGRQLIQRLVTSNPSPAYVRRVAAVFDNDGMNVRGNLAAVVRAILLDEEARHPDPADRRFGKLREPILRFTGWARAYDATSPSGDWGIGNLSNPATQLGQSPLRAPSVFNFFRPGYVPPGTALGGLGLMAPEFQITNETSVIGYVNFMNRVVKSGIGDVAADYSALLPLAKNPEALLEEINVVLAAGQISAETRAVMAQAIGGMPAGTATALNNRICAALLMVLASPEYLVQK